MLIFLIVITGLTLWAIGGSIVVARRDGYRQQPRRGH
jgi:hypothetical protein